MNSGITNRGQDLYNKIQTPEQLIATAPAITNQTVERHDEVGSCAEFLCPECDCPLDVTYDGWGKTRCYCDNCNTAITGESAIPLLIEHETSFIMGDEL